MRPRRSACEPCRALGSDVAPLAWTASRERGGITACTKWAEYTACFVTRPNRARGCSQTSPWPSAVPSIAGRAAGGSIFGMASSYEQAVSALYRAPHESFVSERRRLAEELKSEGDQSGAAQLAKLGRPPLSAWAVNQLWWQARDAFDELFETAAQLRKGKLSASPAHRKAIARLGVRAQQLLNEGGHSANDATLRRIATTLAGLAAAGSFEPDTPGALSKDRDPPGFEAFGIASASDEQIDDEPAVREKSAPRGPAHAAKNDGKARDTQELASAEPHEADAKRVSKAEAVKRKREADTEAAQRKREAEREAAKRRREAEAEAAERKRDAEAQAKRQAQRKKLEIALREARAELAERDRLAKQLATAERELERARASVAAAQAELETERAS